MERIKVILSLRPGMLRKVLRKRIGCQPDMEIVGELTDPVAVLIGAAETEADVVILAAPSGEPDPGICSHLLGEYPHLVILALDQERGVTLLYHRVATREIIPDISEEKILSLIRNTVNEPNFVEIPGDR